MQMKPGTVKKAVLRITLVAIAAGCVVAASASDITYSGGGGDLTFFYDSGSDAWDIVFREKGDTQATGLTSQADQSRFGASPSDFNFNSLTVQLWQPGLLTLNERLYYSSLISDPAGGPDLGVRTRLREDSETDQFSRVTISLNLPNSTLPANADFAMFGFDPFGDPIVRYETAAGKLSEDWGVWGHTHWHWGFSKPGDYALAFDVQGVLPDESLSSFGATLITFQVVPEPTTWVLLTLGAIGLMAWRRRAPGQS